MARVLLVAGCVLALADAFAGATPEIAIPAFNDEYSAFVRQLEAGQTDIDYRKFRESFLASRQFEIATSKKTELRELRDKIPGLIKQTNTAGLLQTTKQILSIDYTDMYAHKILRQTYNVLGDEASGKKYHDIEFGLLKSIVSNGDGKTCKTAWPVIQVEEEYFILDIMVGATPSKQSVVRDGGLCDRMEVTTAQGPGVYYFDIAKTFEGYRKLLKEK